MTFVNALQKQWLMLGLAAMVAMLIYPPWTKTRHEVVLGITHQLMQTETEEFAGYAFLLEPPPARQLANPPYAGPGDFYESVSMSLDRLFVQWAIAVCLTGVGLLYFKTSDKKSLAEWWSSLGTSGKPPTTPEPPQAPRPAPRPVSGTGPSSIAGGADKPLLRYRMPPWRRAWPATAQASALGFFLGVAGFYRVNGQTDLTPLNRMFMAGCLGIVLAVGLGAATFVVAALYFAMKGEEKVTVQPRAVEAQDRAVAFGSPWPAQANRRSAAVASGNQPGAQARAADEFAKDFFEKYPDLIPYEAVVDAVSRTLAASGYTAPTREAVMETYATAARREVARQHIARLVAAARQGDPSSQFILGWRLEKGDGVKQDYAQAAFWYLQAAKKGNITAQNNLGVLYQAGLGVPQNDREAFVWYSRAALHGEAHALNNLGVMYETGQFQGEDRIEAYAMFGIAAGRGSTDGASNRDRLAKSLSADQISEGRQRADSFLGRKRGDW